jgi:hypothetical protein
VLQTRRTGSDREKPDYGHVFRFPNLISVRDSRNRGRERAPISRGSNKKTPERFLVSGCFRSAGAFIKIVVVRTPTRFLNLPFGLSLSCRIPSKASRVPNQRISGIAAQDRRFREQSGPTAHKSRRSSRDPVTQFDGKLFRFEHNF